MRSSPRSSNLGILFLALAPFALMALVVAVQSHPRETAWGAVDLTGTWKLLDYADSAAADPELDDSAWDQISLPGSFSEHGVVSDDCWLRRHFDLKPAMLDKNLFLMIGDTRDTFVNLYVNGHFVGSLGDPETRYKQRTGAIWGWSVPASYLRAQDNVIALNFVVETPAFAGPADHRMLIGLPGILKPYLDANLALHAVFEHGAILVLLTGLGLLGFLLFLEWRTGDRYLYLSAALFVAATIVFLLGATGLGLSSFFPFHVQASATVAAFPVLLLLSVEFIEHYYLGRTTVLRRINRGVCAFVTVLGLIFYARPLLRDLLYLAFVPYMLSWQFVLVGYSVRALVLKQRRYALPLMSVTGVMALSAINDALTDLGVLATPRFFVLAVTNMAVLLAIVVVGEFLRISQDNAKLSTSLAKSNEALTGALEQAKESVRIKSNFLANISHELRTPLNSIINIPAGLVEDFVPAEVATCAACGELFALYPEDTVDAGTECPACNLRGQLSVDEQLTFDGDATATVRYLQTISRSGQHLLNVVNDVLDMSRLEVGRVRLHPEAVELQPVIGEVIESMNVIAAKRGITLEVEAPNSKITLVADGVKLAQIAINLISNAIKFSPEGGVVEVRLEADETMAHIWVRDYGIGIHSKDQAYIFDSFRQVEESDTRRFGGAGLGLAITKGLVELHHGEISVESSKNKGSTFHVRLPRQQVDPDRVQRVEPSANRGSLPLVLLVDDESEAHETTMLALSRLDCRVETTLDAESALALIEEHQPSLVILDIMMPRLSGVTILQQMRSHPQLRDLPVLVSSAYPANREMVSELGARWISKPWHTDELQSAVRELLDTAISAKTHPHSEA